MIRLLYQIDFCMYKLPYKPKQKGGKSPFQTGKYERKMPLNSK